jgi:hypothetical protein
MKPLRAGPKNPVPAPARGRRYQPGRVIPAEAAVPSTGAAPGPDHGAGQADTRTLLEESP